MHEPAPTPAPGPQLIRAIGRWSLAALTVNSIIGSGIFGLPSLIAGLLGRASPWAYLLAAAGMGVVMACFAEVASRFTGAGGPYLYARVAFGRFVGIQMGWLSWLVRVTAGAANANLFTIYLAEFWPGAKQPLARVLVLTALIGIITAVNYRGVKQGTQISNIFTAGKMFPLALLIIAGLIYLATGHHAVPQPDIRTNAESWLQATLLLVFAYGGFEGALMPLGEARNPRRDAPFALFTALLTCTLIYTSIQVVVMAVLANPQATDRPLATAAHQLLGPAGGGLIALGALISVYGYLAAHMINAPRLTFALAEHGDIPPVFASIHARFRTPHVSIVIFGLAVWALAFWGNFKWNVVVSAASRLFTFAVVCAAVIQLRKTQRDRATFRLPAGILFAVLGIVFSLVLITRMGRHEFLVLAVTALISFLNWLWARRDLVRQTPVKSLAGLPRAFVCFARQTLFCSEVYSQRMSTPLSVALDSQSRRRSRLSAVAVTLFFLVLAGRLLRLTSRYAVNIFFWDQWVFNNATLFQHHSAWEMFRWQFGPRLGLGPLISKLYDPHFQWNSRAESYLACGIVILAAACALCLKHRLFGEISVTDIAIPILFLSASQYEPLFINTDLAHGPLPLLLITLYCLAWTCRNVAPRYTLVLILNFLTTYTAFGLFLGLLTPPLLILDYWVNLKNRHRGALYSVLAVSLSLVSLASYFYGYKLQPAVNCFSPQPHAPAQYLWYASLMFSNLWITSTGFFSRLVGFLVILGLVWVTCMAFKRTLRPNDPPSTVYPIAATLASFSLLFAFGAAYGRVCLGLITAQSSRYMPYLVLGIFGTYLYVCSVKRNKIRRVLLGIMVVALLATVPIRAADRNTMMWGSNVKRTWRSCYLLGGSISECDAAAGYRITPEPAPVLQQKLDFLKERHLNLFCTTR